ncbi:calcium-binding protein [Rubellimicrobium aerolatum]|uniref:Calcium-binding protein n=1 Tax=Rubellimicrobium aerolatum TaxID=490979 RepID=A0ABW0SH36_9RHOB|nr:calcium-binding protein [Rubellimicrobium aerolatum]MBP1807596.1 Ca2+-binding RTX toxin-like protein [Rubellimicrobium aerolatum]
MKLDKLIGTRIDDVLVGTSGPTLALGLFGDDRISGDGPQVQTGPTTLTLQGGSDWIFGGAGNDTLYGEGETAAGPGQDGWLSVLVGRSDVIDGGAGDDVVYGEGTSGRAFSTGLLIGADDTLDGGAGNDVVWGDGLGVIGRGRSTLTGGDDIVRGGSGNDQLVGDGRAENLIGGDDLLIGGAGHDTLSGDGLANPFLEGGDDRLIAGAGDDTLYGDGQAQVINIGPARLVGGDDLLEGGAGNDVMFGDGTIESAGFPTSSVTGGADTFVFAARAGIDTIMDFRASDGDVIDLSRTRLDFRALDSDRSGILDAADAHVAGDGSSLSLDLGAALHVSRAGSHVVTLVGVLGLTEGDFLFA